MKLLAVADIHANKQRANQVVKLIADINNIAKQNNVSAILFCGDFFDSAITNTKASGFSDILEAMKTLCSSHKVIMIYGTPSHEPMGCLTCFETLGATIISKPKTLRIENYTLLAIPEPRRSDFIRKSTKETSDAILQALEEVCSIKVDLIMFHGEISGAFLQNGEKASSDIQLSKTLIEKTGAKITLAGHIHLPQEVYPNILYCGSPIPCNYGETHKPSLVLVDLQDNKATYKRLSLDFPTMKTVEGDKAFLETLEKLNLKNINLKIKLSLTDDERKFFHPIQVAKKIKDATNASDVKITIVSKKEQNIRSKEIIKKTSMLDKLKVYAEINNIQLSKSVLEKAKETEDNLLIKYQFPTHSFELLSLSLRGAIGLKDYEQFDIDFRQYEQGVLGLIGANGKGKSTILENCSPYPRLLTRSGSLRNHFYLKDSHRIVIYSDENGRLYKLTIQIAAHVKSGLIRYFAETSDDLGVTWKSVPECDGSLETYTKYVNDTFGSVEIYLRTAFFAKEQVKGVPDISSATKSERIALFSELIGTDNISSMHDIVKEKMKNIETEMKSYSHIEEQLEETSKSLSDITEEQYSVETLLEDCNSKLSDLNNNLSDLKPKQENFLKHYGNFTSVLEMKAECESNIEATIQDIQKLKEIEKRNRIFIDCKKNIEEYNSSKKMLPELEKEYRLKNSELISAMKNNSELKEDYNETKSKWQIENDKFDRLCSKIEMMSEQSIEISDNCPTCGAKLSQKKKMELFVAQNHFENELNALKESKESLYAIRSKLKKQVTEKKELLDNSNKDLESISITAKESENSYQATKAYLEINSEYSGFEDFIPTPLENIANELQKKEQYLKSQKAMLQELSASDFTDYSKEIKDIENKISELTTNKISLSVKLATLKSNEEQILKIQKDLNNQKLTVDKLSSEYKDYSILLNAYSNSGIMNLELEAAAPDIASIANKILSESYGDKFSISFSTVHQGREKIIDDFSIDITNTETGRVAPIEYLSSGEKVWIMQALYYAFSIIRMERTGFSFKIRFIDESDGTLDSEMRLKYLNMINSAHKAGNARLTVLITHSQELKELLTQTIEL